MMVLMILLIVFLLAFAAGWALISLSACKNKVSAQRVFGGVLIVAYLGVVVWTITTYPKLEQQEYLIQDYGVALELLGVTERSKYPDHIWRTTKYSRLELWREVKVSKGDSLSYHVLLEGGNARYYYLVTSASGSERYYSATCCWNMPCWKTVAERFLDQ